MRRKDWNGYPITKVMRALHQADWSNQKITEFFFKAGIRISTTTVANEKHKLKQGAPVATLTSSDWDEINTIMEREFRDAPPPPKEEFDDGDEDSPPPPPRDDSKLLALMQQMTSTLGSIDTRLTVLEAYKDEYKSKIEQIEEIALATCKKIEVKLPHGETKELDEMPHPMLNFVLKLVQGCMLNGKRERLNIALVGPAGSGKTYLAGQISRILDFDFGFTTCTAGMSEAQLLGRSVPGKNGEFVYQRTDFVRLTEGGWDQKKYKGGLFLFDEMDGGDSNTTLIVNTVLDGTRLAVPNRIDQPYAVKTHNTIYMGALNTWGHGADRQYVGRNQLDSAFLNRWEFVELDYSAELEAYLCPDTELRQRIQTYRDNCRKGMVRRVISSRNLKRAFILKTIGAVHPMCRDIDETIDKLLFAGWKKEEEEKARGIF